MQQQKQSHGPRSWTRCLSQLLQHHPHHMTPPLLLLTQLARGCSCPGSAAVCPGWPGEPLCIHCLLPACLLLLPAALRASTAQHDSRSAVDFCPLHDINPGPWSTGDGAVVAVLHNSTTAGSTQQHTCAFLRLCMPTAPWQFSCNPHVQPERCVCWLLLARKRRSSRNPDGRCSAPTGLMLPPCASSVRCSCCSDTR